MELVGPRERARSRRTRSRGGPITHLHFSMEDTPAFLRARDIGLGLCTVRFGREGRPPAQIRVAIDKLFAQRVGHGTTLLDDPAVLDLVLSNEVVIGRVPPPNVQTSAVARRSSGIRFRAGCRSACVRA